MGIDPRKGTPYDCAIPRGPAPNAVNTVVCEKKNKKHGCIIDIGSSPSPPMGMWTSDLRPELRGILHRTLTTFGRSHARGRS